MNGQVNYIIHASLLLAVFAGTVLFFRNFPSELIGNQQEEINIDPPSSTLSAKAQNGKTLFQSKCASCHSLTKELTGPALQGFEERGPWADSNKLYEWIKNPAAFIEKDAYTRALKKKYVFIMQAFPEMSREEIDAIRSFITN